MHTLWGITLLRQNLRCKDEIYSRKLSNLEIFDSNLAAVISSQTVKQDNGETSGKQDAIMARIDQDKSFAFIKRASPGFFCFSHSAKILKSSTGIHMLSSEKRVSPPLSAVSEYDEGLVFFLDCMPFKTVNI
jgi:hypothetical protein